MAADVYVMREFESFARKWGISDSALVDVVRRIEAGDKTGCHGGALYKRRLKGEARGSRDLRGAVAAIERNGSRAVYMSGFAKDNKETLSPREEKAFRAQSKQIMRIPDDKFEQAVVAGLFRKVEERNGDKS